MPSGTPNVVIATPTKPAWSSRTLWLNALVLMLAVAEAKLGFLQGWLPVNAYALIAFVLPVANAGLRVLTAGALTFGLTRTAADDQADGSRDGSRDGTSNGAAS